MRENFNASLKHVLKHEGGYVDHPRDPGGATNKGITIATFRRYVNRNGTKDDLKRIKDSEVATVYKRHYWDKVRGDDLPSGIDYAVFDFAVNSGPGRAAKFLQRVLGVAQDGAIGPATIAAARKANARRVIEQLCANRLAFMKRIKSKGKRLWDTFGRGWTARVSAVETHAMEMASEVIEFTLPPQKPVQSVSASQPIRTPEKPKPAPTAKSGGKTGIVAAIVVVGAGIWATLSGWACSIPIISNLCGG